MSQDINSLITGLSTSLNAYLGMGIQNQMEQAKEERKNTAAQNLEVFKSDLETKRSKEAKDYDLYLKGKLSAGAIAKMYPEHVPLFEKFEADNGREATVDEVDTIIKNSGQKNVAQEQKELNRKQRIDTTVLGEANKLRNNKIIMAAKQAGVSVDQVDELLSLADKGNTVAFQAAAARTARAMGEVGVLTDQDLERYVRSKQVTQGFADKIKTLMTGSATNMTTSEIKEAAKLMRTAYQTKVQDEIDGYVNTVHENLKDYGITVEGAAKRLDVTYGGMKQGKRKEETKSSEKPTIHTYPSGKKAIFQNGKWEPYNG